MGGVPKSCAIGTSCYGITQTVSNVAVYYQDPGDGPAIQSDIFTIHDNQAHLLMSAWGSVTAQISSHVIPGHLVLWVTVKGNGSAGPYHGPYASAICGGCPETQLIAFNRKKTTWSRFWTSAPMAGSTESVALSHAHGQQGFVTQIDSLTAGETHFNGTKIAVVPGDLASYNPARPERVWQWYRGTFAVAQIGLDVAPISASSPYAGQNGVEVRGTGYIAGSPSDGGYGSALLPTSDSALQSGSIITKVNGIPVTTIPMMVLVVERAPIGSSVLIQGSTNSVPFRVLVPVRTFPPGWSHSFLQIHTASISESGGIDV